MRNQLSLMNMDGHTHDPMCESRVILYEGEQTTTIMEAAAIIRISDNKASCTDITGEEVVLSNVKLSEINLMKHEVIFERGE